MMTSGLYWSIRRLAACEAGSGEQARVLVLDGELVAVDAGLVELLERELDALLVLRAEIGARPGHRKQRADLDRLVLRVRSPEGDARDQTQCTDGQKTCCLRIDPSAVFSLGEA